MKTAQLLLALTTSALPFFLAVEGFNPPQANAESANIDRCRALVGTYLLTTTDAQGNFVSRDLVTLTSDGNVIFSGSDQGGIPGILDPFGTTQGSWTCSRRNVIEGIGLNFTFGPAGGITRLDFHATFNSQTNTSTGSSELRFFRLQDDPLNASGPAAATFTFTGQRVSK